MTARGSLAVVGQLFGQLAQPQGDNVIELSGPMLVFAGDELNLCLTVTDEDDARVDLSDFAIELQVKPAVGAPDPPTIALAVGSGIILRDQDAPSTKGQADVQMTSEGTTQAPGLYWLDVVVVPGSGARTHVVAPREFTIAGVVNLPT